MPQHEAINYVEIPSRDMVATKAFFESCFGWKFTEYSPQYMAYSDGTIETGVYQSESVATTASGSALVVFYSERLEETMENVIRCGGTIVQPIFSFPGGRRFQFAEPSGTELAVWTDVNPG